MELGVGGSGVNHLGGSFGRYAGSGSFLDVLSFCTGNHYGKEHKYCKDER
jgi:hypothetical protein